jgi:hypothetical protein
MCDAAWSASENGARLDFYTTDANASESKVLTLDSDKLATFPGAVTVTGALTGTLATVAQDNITSCEALATIGTITTGVWRGSVIASSYLDADTAHLSGSQTFTGTKTLNSFKGTGATTVTNILDEDAMGSDSATALATQQSIKAYTTATHATAQTGKSYRMYNMNFRDDIVTTKHYLPLKGILEQAALTREEVSELSVTDGRVASITLRVENIQGTHGDAIITFGIETNIAGVGYDNSGGGAGSAWSVIETEALAVNHTDDDHVFHYVFDDAKHWDSTDMWAVFIQSNVDMSGSNERFFVTVVVEDDWSTYLGIDNTSSAELTTTP